MSLSVHTNQSSLTAQRSLASTQLSLNTSQQRLSTGLRINSAKDDAAGLQIANRMESQTRGLSVAQRNAADGISLAQTAEGALKEASNILQRQRELALQSANGTNTTADKTALNEEFTALNDELKRIKSTTTFAGRALFASAGGLKSGISFQVGAEMKTADKITVKVDTASAFKSSSAITGSAGAIAGVVSGLTTAIKDMGSAMANLGAVQNRFQSTINNLSNIEENVSVAKGRIMDADIAKESANMTKQNMMMQAGISVLSQANQTPSMIMGLLR
ncbi:MAG: flagellin [Plesiomonas shigelloides]|uniref:flagellin N-terminal helical domain-containing protein n=1 Tax=Plesiomonas shigelloides TaxID=703 RepID=UPI00057B0F75|nr:flagellin [Plesiomonas shigelloides]MDT1011807.1 flagellin [Plesiomonas shigelloides]QIY09017.1 flagellin [Plesiomonas shigelloides]HAD40639.1 flagellin [Plesiomonas shigelloides]